MTNEKGRAQFVAELEQALSKAGFSVGQLADGVPIGAWFEIGLSPQECVLRAAAWRPAREGRAPANRFRVEPSARRRAPRSDRGVKRGAQHHAKRKEG